VGSGAGFSSLFEIALNGTIPSTGLNIPLANGPSLLAAALTNNVYGVASFANGVTQNVYGHIPVSVDAPTIVVDVQWSTADTTIAHTVIFQIYYACSATAYDPSLTSGGTVTANAPASQYQMTSSTITITTSGCTAGQELYFQLANNGATATVVNPVQVSRVRVHN
jgi:hypothetical protein